MLRTSKIQSRRKVLSFSIPGGFAEKISSATVCH